MPTKLLQTILYYAPAVVFITALATLLIILVLFYIQGRINRD